MAIDIEQIRRRLELAEAEHAEYPHTPCGEVWSCRTVRDLLTALDTERKRHHRLVAAARVYLYSEDGTEEEHHTFCSIYDPVEGGDCDCGWGKVAALLPVEVT